MYSTPDTISVQNADISDMLMDRAVLNEANLRYIDTSRAFSKVSPLDRCIAHAAMEIERELLLKGLSQARPVCQWHPEVDLIKCSAGMQICLALY